MSCRLTSFICGFVSVSVFEREREHVTSIEYNIPQIYISFWIPISVKYMIENRKIIKWMDNLSQSIQIQQINDSRLLAVFAGCCYSCTCTFTYIRFDKLAACSQYIWFRSNFDHGFRVRIYFLRIISWQKGEGATSNLINILYRNVSCIFLYRIRVLFLHFP